MANNLNLDKIMYFKQGEKIESVNYGDAVQKLGYLIEAQGSPDVILGKVTNALKQVAGELMQGKTLEPGNRTVSDDAFNTVAGFYTWVRSIHNDKLIPDPQSGSPYPNNIVYDMLQNLRNRQNLPSDEALLKFFLDGANGRKISNGNTPNLRFISTEQAIEAISAVQQSTGIISRNAAAFLEAFKGYESYKTPQQVLIQSLTDLKQNDFYSFLENKEILNFSREIIPETGANKYFIDEAINTGSTMQYNGTESSIRESVTKLCEIVSSASKGFSNASKNVGAEAESLAKWDASEWLSRAYVTLAIAETKLPELEGTTERLMNENPFFKDVIERSRVGNFPGAVRDKKLESVELVPLFNHDAIDRSTLVKARQKKFDICAERGEANQGASPG